MPHLHFFVHALLHVDRAALLHPDRFELPTVCKCAFADFLERVWKCDLFDSTLIKACLSNVLYTIRDFDALEIFAFIEYT